MYDEIKAEKDKIYLQRSNPQTDFVPIQLLTSPSKNILELELNERKNWSTYSKNSETAIQNQNLLSYYFSLNSFDM